MDVLLSPTFPLSLLSKSYSYPISNFWPHRFLDMMLLGVRTFSQLIKSVPQQYKLELSRFGYFVGSDLAIIIGNIPNLIVAHYLSLTLSSNKNPFLQDIFQISDLDINIMVDIYASTKLPHAGLRM